MYFEAVDRVLPKLKKFIRPPDGSDNEMELWLMMEREAGLPQLPGPRPVNP